MNQHSFFAGRSIVIASKHKKQNAMAALLEKELGVICIVPENFIQIYWAHLVAKLKGN
jgi:hypothetical protein